MTKPHPVVTVLFVLLFSFLGFYAGALAASLLFVHGSGLETGAEIFIHGVIGFFLFLFLSVWITRRLNNVQFRNIFIIAGIIFLVIAAATAYRYKNMMAKQDDPNEYLNKKPTTTPAETPNP